MIITIDGGSTNTRLYLWKDKNILLAEDKARIGAQTTAVEGNNTHLKQEISRLINELIYRAGVSMEQIECIYASGMITSELGLFEVPHLIAPVSAMDLADGIRRVKFPEICPMEISFIPGVKNISDEKVLLNNIEEMDIMRGEETEVFGVLAQDEAIRDLIVILPGTHTKIVFVKDRKIQSCITSMSGEMLQLLTEYSILSEAVHKMYVTNDGINKEYLVSGFEKATQTESFGRAAFLARICSKFIDRDPQKIASFLLGVILNNDVNALVNSDYFRRNKTDLIMIHGKEPLSSCLKELLERKIRDIDIKVLDNDSIPLSGRGALYLNAYCEAKRPLLRSLTATFQN